MGLLEHGDWAFEVLRAKSGLKQQTRHARNNLDVL